MGSSSGDGGEVFDGATHAVAWWEGVVDGLAAENAGFVAGFPFGFDAFRCGVAVEFRLSSGGDTGCDLVWIVCSPFATVLQVALIVVGIPLSGLGVDVLFVL